MHLLQLWSVRIKKKGSVPITSSAARREKEESGLDFDQIMEERAAMAKHREDDELMNLIKNRTSGVRSAIEAKRKGKEEGGSGGGIEVGKFREALEQARGLTPQEPLIVLDKGEASEGPKKLTSGEVKSPAKASEAISVEDQRVLAMQEKLRRWENGEVFAPVPEPPKLESPNHSSPKESKAASKAGGRFKA